MKKTYTKPEIDFEAFTLSTNIAGNCQTIVPTPSNGTCGYAWEGGGGDKMFTTAVADCDTKIDDDPNNPFCYHVPEGSSSLFNS